MNDIEKCAKLMGYERDGDGESKIYYRPINVTAQQIESGDYPVMTFNPFLRQSDLMDFICFIGIDISWGKDRVYVDFTFNDEFKPISHIEYIPQYSGKFTALAHAVIAVAVQIYDKQFGGE